MKSEHVSDEDFLIQVTPMLGDDAHWTGQVEINIISSDASPLNTEETEALLFFCQMICASVPIYEDHDNIREMAAWMVKSKYTEEGKKKLNGKQVRTETINTGGNVIKIDFTPKKEH